jgi:hypothetical protein
MSFFRNSGNKHMPQWHTFKRAFPHFKDFIEVGVCLALQSTVIINGALLSPLPFHTMSS